MPIFRTQHKTEGTTTVAAGDSYSYVVEDAYRRLIGVDLVGDVEREISVVTDENNQIGLFGDAGKTIAGEGDIDCEVELSQGDTVKIEYQDAGEVSDILRIRTDRPLNYRVYQLAKSLETNEV